MPKWKPGTQKGEAVRVKYTVPVMFRLTENNTQVKYAPIESKIDEMVVVGYAPEEATVPEEVTVFKSEKKCRNILRHVCNDGIHRQKYQISGSCTKS